jgi:glycosyltransferase involved in cell wall biosynthesis
MKVVHVTLGSVDPNSSNGINRVIEGLAKSMNASGLADVSVVTIRKKMQHKGREVIRTEVDLVHLHNAWSVTNVLIGRWLVRRGIPYVLTPHAAFLSDRMTQKRNIKLLFHTVFQKKLLDQAAALIAVSRDEIQSIAQYTSNEHIVFVPNGTDAIGTKIENKDANQIKPTSRLKIGYLGRISREKNILALIKAVSLLPAETRSQIKILLYGDSSGAYGNLCSESIRALGLASTVFFCGQVSTNEKWDRLRELDLYIQPSLSEAASISVLEAISQSLPLIATRTSGVSYWQGQLFFTMTEPTAFDIARGIEEVVNKRNCLNEMGGQAGEYFRSNFTWGTVSKRMYATYSKIVNHTMELQQ